uniref:PRA1 family protein n=1 Tax=Romanomermis culicivorax TaxID=13658 RepID=A0A915JLD6_ROMCU
MRKNILDTFVKTRKIFWGSKSVSSFFVIGKMAALTQDVDLAPLRNMDDFLLGSARFGLPPYKDMDRWANRIIKNLIYYQTNYFAIIVTFFVLIR